MKAAEDSQKMMQRFWMNIDENDTNIAVDKNAIFRHMKYLANEPTPSRFSPAVVATFSINNITP